MKDTQKELAELFADSRLVPDPKYERNLQKALVGKPKGFMRRLVAPVSAVALVVLVLLGVALIQPPAPKELASKSVLVRSLYASALAEELPGGPKNTFWSITSSYNYGPAATECGFTEASIQKVPSTTSLYYDNGVTTAYYAYGGYADEFQVLGYSDDPDVKAFSPEELNSSQSSQIRGILIDAVLTDKNGNQLSKDATIPYKESGIYDIYAKVVTTPEDVKNYVAGCETLQVHIQIDASKGSYNKIEVYKDSIADDNLFHANNQLIETKQASSFNQVQPIFEAAGFDLEAAKARTAEFDYLAETNSTAGVQFFYRKSALGKPSVTAVKNDDGVVTEYRYTFSKQPEVVYHFRTSAGLDTAEYKNVAELKAEALEKGWTIIDDDKQDSIVLRDYGPTKSHYFKAHDGKSYYMLTESGSSDIPSVYVTIPYGLGDRTSTDPYMDPNFVMNDLLSPASAAVYFKPGTSPPKGL